MCFVGMTAALRAYAPIYMSYDGTWVEAPKNFHIHDVPIIVISKHKNVLEILTNRGIRYVFEHHVCELT